MAILENFPQALLDEHMAWHMNPPGTPGGRSKTNRGLDFLNFHRAFLAKVFDWFGKQPADYRAKYDLSPDEPRQRPAAVSSLPQRRQRRDLDGAALAGRA